MGQGEVLELLAKYSNKEFSERAICDVYGRQKGSFNTVLKKLRDRGEVNWKMVERSDGKLEYMYKHKPEEETTLSDLPLGFPPPEYK